MVGTSQKWPAKAGGRSPKGPAVAGTTVLPVMVYDSETWALKKAHMVLLSVAQRKMERIMLGITLRDHKRNVIPRYDIIDVISKGIHHA